LKIAYISNLVEPTGGDRILYYHTVGLRKLGHTIDPYFTGWIDSYRDHKDGWNDPKIGIKWYDPNNIESLSFSNYDMVVANGLIGAQVATRIDHPNKVWFCQNFDPYIFGPSDQTDYTYNHFNKYLVYSHDLGKIIRHYYGDKKIEVCTNGIEYNLFKPFQRVGVKLNRNRICFMVAYYRNYKGIGLANEVFFELKKRGLITLEINATNGPLENTMEFYRNPSFSVKSETVAGCDFSIHPSVFETWNLTSMESMALGTPVIGTNSKGILEYATKDNSVIFDDRDPIKICDAIDNLYSNQEEYLRLQRNGIITAAAHDWSAIIDKIESSYKKLL
jgi:glycosyltransferase involved in cell wall biosynthesis